MKSICLKISFSIIKRQCFHLISTFSIFYLLKNETFLVGTIKNRSKEIKMSLYNKKRRKEIKMSLYNKKRRKEIKICLYNKKRRKEMKFVFTIKKKQRNKNMSLR